MLIGRGAELERDLPFGVWIDALDDHADWLGPERLQRMLGDRVGELARVLPSVTAATPAAPLALQDERYRAHRAVRALLERLAAANPVIVLLDDLQWADDSSLELVAHLLRRPPHARLVMAVAYRAGGLPSPVLAAFEAAGRDGMVVDVALSPLTSDEADVLLGEELSPRVREELYRLSGGNPFYLEQLAQPAAATGGRRRGRGAGRDGGAGGGGGGPRPGAGRAERAGPPARPGRGGGRRPGRAGARGRRRRARRRRAGRRARRAGRLAADRAGRRAAALSLPAPDRPPCGVRVGRTGLAARRARARRRGAGAHGRPAVGPGAPSRALRGAGRRGGDRGAGPGRARRGAQRAGGGGALVHRRARAPARRGSGPTARAAGAAGHGAGLDRAPGGGAGHAARPARADPARARGAARAARGRLRGVREPARPPRRGARAARTRARRAARPDRCGGGRAGGRAGGRRALRLRLRGPRRAGAAGAGERRRAGRSRPAAR